jgi:tripartite-type tricarboxylate transporter receptor subunit TctC
MLDRRRFLASSSATLASSTLPAWGQADSARIIVGFAPGGSSDAVARQLAIKLGREGTQYIVENRPGAGGRLAADMVKAATPDGRTMLVTPDPAMTLYPHVYKKLGYTPLSDFRPVSILTTVPIALSVGPIVPTSVRTLADFVQWCKANPDKASYGTAGAGSPLHFLGVMFAKANRLQYTHVPFKGGAPAAQDMMGGQIASSINVISEITPLLPTGKVRVLAVSGKARSRFLPDIPTFAEAGFDGAPFEAWFGLFVPAKTPDSVVKALNAAAVQGFKSADARDALAKLSFEVAATTPEEASAIVRADLDRWGPVVKESGFSADD